MFGDWVFPVAPPVELSGWSSSSSSSLSPHSSPAYEYCFAFTHRLVFWRLTLVFRSRVCAVDQGDSGCWPPAGDLITQKNVSLFNLSTNTNLRIYLPVTRDIGRLVARHAAEGVPW
ncbi:hypothetical protein H112_07367 [Trichophyton rubrum D6]|uniref:Uncharacterized protein n=3 Tax=Trichophyton TaxID=5550 RepID=A0A080WF97_TRIRC|nr:uncharacterized protein TERG_11880 [Trichophyton rubrum CBS 118892]EZF11556.1 hypothetical protein H100_07394 [Trichophyton rubrum MR850]EZF38407.1 hypothetical protein H102_07356 [Trichophyton rubrum CBS 100081]EZF49071.1 hypothetical protein H103_07378 [Trichophyton rubrum CBS 288.86]EZF59702.1 hypothetical protein H104_07330 [Trichophyton rubrum CBS 289.86]EZF70336.1 hypothetical protein H105_07393 [Trichophyton soudanense CBS 452.61]EZF80988.1 hypothetical protein H110_07376 [Trichophy